MSSLVASRHTTSFPTTLDYLGETRWKGSPPLHSQPCFVSQLMTSPILDHIFILMKRFSAGPSSQKLLYVSGRRKKCQDLRLQGPMHMVVGFSCVSMVWGTRFWFISTLATKSYRFCVVFPTSLAQESCYFGSVILQNANVFGTILIVEMTGYAECQPASSIACPRHSQKLSSMFGEMTREQSEIYVLCILEIRERKEYCV